MFWQISLAQLLMENVTMKMKLALAVSAIVLGALASPVLADKPAEDGTHSTHGNSADNANDGNKGGNDNSGKGQAKANNPGSQVP
jgi:hypothetical protein